MPRLARRCSRVSRWSLASEEDVGESSVFG
ncbi:Uncharacterised protein [Mycobacteroides abscessus subsp. abscessus]|nr:Uncharacterised protein [Mycobacteroides abscessus subsp. abscessus]